MVARKRVVIRRVEPSDYPFILRWQNEEEVFKGMGYERLFSAEDIRESEERAVREGHPFVVEAEGLPIGRIGLNNVRRRDEVASLYLFIGEPGSWGQGYGHDAVMAVLAYGFDAMNLRMIELWTHATNERALRLYKGCGFVEDARLRDRSFKEGRYVDHVIMSITREEFARVRSAEA